MAEKRPLDDAALDRLLDEARAGRPAPPEELTARILADAEAEAAARRPAPMPRAVRPGALARLVAALGGWPSAAGLATATVAGLAIGLSAPETLETLSGGLLAADGGVAVDALMPSYGDLWGEG